MHRAVFRETRFTHRSFHTEKRLLQGTGTFPHSSFCARRLLHKETFYKIAHRNFYAEKLFTPQVLQGSFYAQKLLHKKSFPQRSFYTHTHAEAFTHGRVYTEESLQTDAFIHRSFCTQKLLHRVPVHSFHTEKSLGDFRQGSFTHRNSCTRKLLHTEAFEQEKT